MGSLWAILKNPDDLYPLLKLKMAVRHAGKQIPPEPHWGFCYTILHKFYRTFGFLIQQLDTDLRNSVCIFFLVLEALDTVEYDTSITNEGKVPILSNFLQHIQNRDLNLKCGTNESKVLMEQIHHVWTAFLELGEDYRKAIADITLTMGAGMAKSLGKEVQTIDEYDNWCNNVGGLFCLGLTNLFQASRKEDLPSDKSYSMGLFLLKTSIIRDYLEHINAIPKSGMLWPRDIWGKYVNELEIMAIGSLAMCYNNVEVFRGVVRMRRGLTAKVIDRTKTMSDVYCAFFDFSCVMMSKVDMKDPSAKGILRRLEAIQNVCKDSGLIASRKSYIIRSRSRCSALVTVLFLILAIVFAYLSNNRSSNNWIVYRQKKISVAPT